MSHQVHQENISTAMEAVLSLQENARRDPHRLKYHFMERAAWINDPNGMIYFNDEYHLFYQIHPFSAFNGTKHWGHAKSKDLVHWEHLPIALAPSEPHELNGCFSGTAVDDHGVLTLIYTGNVRDPKTQVQCIATSRDGIVFEKYAENPVIREYPAEGSRDFRDPKVWDHEGIWYMAIGSGKDGKANALLYKSADLLTWDYIGLMAESNGTQGSVWNCPDFFTLNGKDVLLISPGVSPENKDEIRKSVYIVGALDYETGIFTQKYDDDIDFGFDFYAPQTLVDGQGRIVLFGWMDMWWNTMPSQKYDWAGAMTIPRIVTFLPDGKLNFKPAPELQQLRKDHKQWGKVQLNSNNISNLLQEQRGESLEIIAVFDSLSDDSEFGFKLRCSPDQIEETVVTFLAGSNLLSVDRSKSGIGDKGVSSCTLTPTMNNELELHIFLDSSSVEVFGNGGRVVMSNRIYPSASSQGLELFVSKGSVHVKSLDIWNLQSIWEGM